MPRPVACCLLLLFFLFCSSCFGPCCRRACACACACACSSWARCVQRLLADFPKKGQQSEKKNEAKTKATKRKWAKNSSNFAGSNKSQVAFAKNNKIYTDIYRLYMYIKLYNTCCLLRWKIYFFL